MEVQSKPWYESVTTWGIVITLLSGVLSAFGISIGPDTQQAATDAIPRAVEALRMKDWVEFSSILVGLLGVVITTFGRNQAVQPVHFMKPFSARVDPAVVKTVSEPSA